MSSQPPASEHAQAPVADYDADNYDYRQFWHGRDYEHWAESRVIRKLLAFAPRPAWLVDLGGGFGRHVPLYLTHAEHVVLVDYSWTNLSHAEAALAPGQAGDGSLFLVRANLYHLPFRDGAFQLGMTTRVIHHLQAIDDALAEMGRTLEDHWMLDVPIKTHLLARARAYARGNLNYGRDRGPHPVGDPATPFYNFHLGAIRERLAALGWASTVVASVNNFRRWERIVPAPLLAPARPVVKSLEIAAQTVGRGWWGPAQFLWLTRTRPLGAAPMPPMPTADRYAALPRPWAALAPRMICPACHGELAWSAAMATCEACAAHYARQGAIWDFVAG